MRRASVATTKSAPMPGGGLDRDHVERAHAVHRDLEHERQGARGDQTDPEPGERAGPDAHRDRGEVLPHDAGVGHHRLDQRGQLLAVLHPLLGAALGDDVLAVVEGDGHEGRGRVEGEQHASEVTDPRRSVIERSRDQAQRPPVGGDAPVVADQVEGEAGRGVVPERRRRLGVRGDGRHDAAADQQRAAGEGGGAHRVGVADQGGDDVGMPDEDRRERVAVEQPDRVHQLEVDRGGRVVETDVRRSRVLGEPGVEPGRAGRPRAGRGRPGRSRRRRPASRASRTARPPPPPRSASRSRARQRTRHGRRGCPGTPRAARPSGRATPAPRRTPRAARGRPRRR